MVWFKVDDKLHGHRKTRAVRRSHPEKMRDAAPFGIWTLAGSWCGDNNTGGFVPLEVLEEWDDDAEHMASRLVAAGLWHADEVDGEPGYTFNDWPEHNPTNASAFANHVRWHEKRGIVESECEHCPTEPDAPESPADIRAESDGVRRESDGGLPHPPLPVPDPTRPVPEPKKTPSPKGSGNASRPPGFDEFWETYDHKTGRTKAETAYRKALTKPGVTPDLLRAAAAAYIDWQRSEGKHPAYTKHPTTWLNGEHWRDERPARQQAPTRASEHMALARQLANGTPSTPLEIGPSR